MALSLDQIDTYHADRGNSEWTAFDDAKRNALRLKALDYVEGNYAPLVEDAEDHPLYLVAISTLALRISQNPDTDLSLPIVKSEKKEMQGMKKEVEYFEPAATDPFPGVTKLFASLKVSHVAPAFVIGRMVR